MEKRYIRIGFSYPREFKIGAKAISWWLGVPYSHVYIRFESSSSKLPSNVYHAAHGMVHFRSFNNFTKENHVIKEYAVEVGVDSRTEFLAHCMDLSGEGYGYCELLKIFISDLAYSIAKKNMKFKNGKGYICSELVGKLLQEQMGMKFTKPLHLLKPDDIDKALSLIVDGNKVILAA